MSDIDVTPLAATPGPQYIVRPRGSDRLHSHFSQVDPFRRPIWRWDRARQLAERSRRGRMDDDLVLWAARYLRETEAGYLHHRERYQVLVEAQQIYDAGGPRRWELEARILAGQFPAEISDRMSLLPEVIVVFEAFFFQVADCLDAKGYIASQVLRPFFYGPLVEEDAEMLLKGFAYLGGPLILEACLPVLLNPSLDLGSLPDSERLLAVRVRLVVLTRVLCLWRRDLESIAEAWREVQRITQRTQAGVPADVDDLQRLRSKMPEAAALHVIPAAPPPAAVKTDGFGDSIEPPQALVTTVTKLAKRAAPQVALAYAHPPEVQSRLARE